MMRALLTLLSGLAGLVGLLLIFPLYIPAAIANWIGRQLADLIG